VYGSKILFRYMNGSVYEIANNDVIKKSPLTDIFCILIALFELIVGIRFIGLTYSEIVLKIKDKLEQNPFDKFDSEVINNKIMKFFYLMDRIYIFHKQNLYKYYELYSQYSSLWKIATLTSSLKLYNNDCDMKNFKIIPDITEPEYELIPPVIKQILEKNQLPEYNSTNESYTKEYAEMIYLEDIMMFLFESHSIKYDALIKFSNQLY